MNVIDCSQYSLGMIEVAIVAWAFLPIAECLYTWPLLHG